MVSNPYSAAKGLSGPQVFPDHSFQAAVNPLPLPSAFVPEIENATRASDVVPEDISQAVRDVDAETAAVQHPV